MAAMAAVCSKKSGLIRRITGPIIYQ